MPFSHRIATAADIPLITNLMTLSMRRLLPHVLSPQQVEKSYESMGLDTQLIADKTYFLIYHGDILVGCGGWSRRKTLYGGNHTAGRDDTFANPEIDSAKIRAMYTHPNHTRKGVGRYLLELGETAALAEGFKLIELGATASGLLLYEKCGYEIIEDLSRADQDEVSVPIILMRKKL